MDIYISYVQRNGDFAGEVADELRQYGTVWLADEGPRSSIDKEGSLQTRLEACDLLVVIWSPEAVDNAWVQGEIRYVLNQNKPVLPLLVESYSTIPLILANHFYISFVGEDRATGFRRLHHAVQDIGATINRPPTPEVKPASGAQPQPVGQTRLLDPAAVQALSPELNLKGSGRLQTFRAPVLRSPLIIRPNESPGLYVVLNFDRVTEDVVLVLWNNEQVILGRGFNMHLRCVDLSPMGDEATMASRQHAILEHRDLRLFITDQSQNGTQINGSYLARGRLTELKGEDRIRLAPGIELSIKFWKAPDTFTPG